MTQPAPLRTRLLIVHNPSAGLARQSLLGKVDGALKAAGAVVRLETVDAVPVSRRLVAEAVRHRAYDGIIAAGGDSTIRAIAAEIVGTGIPLGIIPVGTGNVLAEELRLPRTPEALASYLLRGEAVEVAPGMANGELFLSMVGAGFDAGVLERLDVSLKRRIGKLAYVWPVLRELWSRRRRFQVLIDGHPYMCNWLIVTRGAHYAGSFVVAQRQRLTDPQLTALVIDARSPMALASVLVFMGLGWASRHPQISSVPCRCVEVPAGPAEGFQLDGEPIDATALEIELARKSLVLIAPEAS